jgi:hypothetical protein
MKMENFPKINGRHKPMNPGRLEMLKIKIQGNYTSACFLSCRKIPK